MFEYIITKGQNKQVNTQLEQFPITKLTRFFPNRQLNTSFSVQINLFQFAYQMHLSKPMSKISSSRRTKFKDYLPYIKKITNISTLNFDISDMDSEQTKQASEIIGEGISRCLISILFGIQENSMYKIKGPGKRPDFGANSNNGEIIICESKGSFNGVSTSEINRAITQKNSRKGHIKIAAINNIGTLSRLIDPPIDNIEEDRFQKLIKKTEHYIQIFRLAGQQELTKYFKLMKKRFENNNLIDFPEFSDKQKLWFKLKYERQRIEVDGKKFVGKVEKMDNNKIMYIGFDENLLNVNTFESFEDYNDIYINKTDNSTTFISKDGICFIEADSRRLQELFPDINLDKIKHYQLSTWLSDIDNMDELEFSNYLQFIFHENNLEFQQEQKLEEYRQDYILHFKNITYTLELKLFKKNFIYRDIKKLSIEDKSEVRVMEKPQYEKIRFLPNVNLKYHILITNKDKRLLHIPKEVIIFDRNELKKLLRNKNYFSEFLSKLK